MKLEVYTFSKELVEKLVNVLREHETIDLGDGEEDNDYEVIALSAHLKKEIKENEQSASHSLAQC